MHDGRRSLLPIAAAVAVVGGLLIAPPVQAAVDFNESFTGSTLNSPANWAASGSTGFPCLTARPSVDGTRNPLALGSGNLFGCTQPALNSDGAGALRLTNTGNGLASTLVYTQSQTTIAGLDISFNLAMYGGSGADGISFYLKDGTSTNYAAGDPGGSLGYTNAPNALLGIGFDQFGNFSNTGSAGSACVNKGPGARANAIAVRGPGNTSDTNGYCYLGGTAAGAVVYSGADRAAATKRIRIVIDPSSAGTPEVKVYVNDALQVTVAQPAELRAASTFKFGFSASTGGSTNNHEVWGFEIDPADPDAVPQAAPAVPVFTVDIDANGGTCSVTKITRDSGTWANLPDATGCTRTDYEFTGFNTAANGSGTQFAPGAPIQITGDNRLFATWKKIVPEPFMCTADLYQVSGTGGGVLYVYDAARNTMDLVPAGGGRSKAPGSNATGYNPADDFIYGIAPNGSARHLWKFGSNGVYEDLGPIVFEATGQPVTNLALIAGDFVDADVLVAVQTPNTILTINVAPTRSGQSALATQVQAPSGAWGAADIAFNADRTVGYGMGANVLYIMKVPGAGSPGQVAAVGQGGSYSRVTVQGVPARATYGASYLDQSNNAYFYNNEQRRIYLITAEELAKPQPTAVPLGTEAAFVLGTTQTLLTPTDGASCAAAPIVTVTLTYQINGGRGTAPDDQVGFVNQEVAVADGVGFTRKDFTFVGWNTAADGSGTRYPAGTLFDLGATGGTLFAQWAPDEPAPVVPPQNILAPIEEPVPEATDNPEDPREVIFTPIKDLPPPPNDPWKPSTVVLIDPDGGNPTPVVEDESGEWSVNNRTGDIRYMPDPTFSGTAQIVVQLQTESGVRFQTTVKTTVPSCQRGRSVQATVYFDVLSSQLSAASQRTLNQLVRRTNAAGIPTCTVVVGYVQPTVNRSNDISLSTSRASSVANYLGTRGIDNIIRTEGLGRADEQGARARRATARIYYAPAPPRVVLDETTG